MTGNILEMHGKVSNAEYILSCCINTEKQEQELLDGNILKYGDFHALALEVEKHIPEWIK